MPVRLVSLNVYMTEALHLVVPFLEREKPDVACLQEVCEEHVSVFARALEAAAFKFVPMTRQCRNGAEVVFGIATFSRLPVVDWRLDYYSGDSSCVPGSDTNDSRTFTNKNHLLLTVTAQNGGETARIAQSHFTWSGGGLPTDTQRQHMAILLDKLDTLGEFVLCGDFNAPRGGEIFSQLAQRYQDDIPPEYATSLDADLHRAGKTRAHELADKMVDGLFTTPGYRASDVSLRFGVSDHAAVIATITRV